MARVYYYAATCGEWFQMGTDLGGVVGSGEAFGVSVSLSDTGTTIAVGAESSKEGTSTDGDYGMMWESTPGKVYLFEWIDANGNWTIIVTKQK
jgi:hypothetical protein